MGRHTVVGWRIWHPFRMPERIYVFSRGGALHLASRFELTPGYML